MLAKKMVECIANMDNVNKVKIYYKKAANKICERMAHELYGETKKYLGTLLKNQSPILSKEAQDITFLLLDRSIDTVTPLMHSFTF